MVKIQIVVVVVVVVVVCFGRHFASFGDQNGIRPAPTTGPQKYVQLHKSPGALAQRAMLLLCVHCVLYHQGT